MVTSCKCDDEPVPEALLPYQNVLESTLISNVVSIGAALNSVYLDLIPDSLGRAKYADAMLRNTRFFSDNQGYFYVESLSGYCIIDAAVPSIEGVYHPDVAYIQEMIEVVKYRGYGWVNYDFTNPLSQILEKKIRMGQNTSFCPVVYRLRILCQRIDRKTGHDRNCPSRF